MCDAYTLAQVARLGYTFNHDHEKDTWWYKKDAGFVGPYKSLDDAAYDALADYEINEAYKFWRGKDARETSN